MKNSKRSMHGMKSGALLSRAVRSWISVGAIVFGAGALAVACGDDDSDSDGSPGGAGGAGGTGGSAGSSGAGGTQQIQQDASGGSSNQDASTDSASPSEEGGDAQVWETLCFDRAGAPLAYDFSRGLAGEYAFELAMNCDLGGFMAPLADADPENLSKVEEYVGRLTEWYRATVLRCADAEEPARPDIYGLVPDLFQLLPDAGPPPDMSAVDFEATVGLFMEVLSRHDDQPDGMSAELKHKLRARLTSFKSNAVKSTVEDFTRRSPMPECLPPPNDDAGSTPQ
jgi:hypothetical protein